MKMKKMKKLQKLKKEIIKYKNNYLDSDIIDDLLDYIIYKYCKNNLKSIYIKDLIKGIKCSYSKWKNIKTKFFYKSNTISIF